MLQRSVAVCILLALCVMGFPAQGVHAATITSCPNSEAALSADIAAAGPGGTVSFNCTAATTIPFTSMLDIEALLGTGTLTLDASHATGMVTFDGQNKTRLFNAYDLTLNHLVLTRGTPQSTTQYPFGDGGAVFGTHVTVLNSVFANNSAPAGSGGAINATQINIANSIFSGNSAGAAGGAIEENNTEEGGGNPVTIAYSVFSRNQAANGGAIETFAKLAVSNSIFSANQATSNGGAIVNTAGGGAVPFAGILTVTGSTFYQGGAQNGGAIWNDTQAMVTDSTFTANSAFQQGQGGAIFNAHVGANSGMMTLTADTFFGSDIAQGGGIFHAHVNANSGMMTLTADTFFGSDIATLNPGPARPLTGSIALPAGAIYNDGPGFGSQSIPTITIGQSILSNSDPTNCLNLGKLLDAGYNLTDSSGNCGLTGPTDITTTDLPLSLPFLQYNGGPTPTLLPPLGSSAIDEGPPACSPAQDQRGFARPYGSACDIGSVEVTGFSQLISNGGFEQGLASWQTAGAPPPAATSLTSFRGSKSAALCYTVNCLQGLAQTVTVPSSVGQAALSFWIRSFSQEPAGSCNDTFYVLLLSPSGSVIAPSTGACGTTTQGWVHASVDLTSSLAPYRGQHVTLLFLGVGNATLPTMYFIDNVAIRVLPAGVTGAPTQAGASGFLHPVAPPACVPFGKQSCPKGSGR